MDATASHITDVSIIYWIVVQAQIKENIKAPRHWPLEGGNSPLTNEFAAQRANNAENAFIWWRHHIVFW